MKELNQIQHKYLGHIVCMADENGNPLEWNKTERICLFKNENREIKISFDFFCFNLNFEAGEVFSDMYETVEKNIVNSYKHFLNDRKEIEETFFKYYKDEIEPELIAELITTSIEEIYSLIEVVEVRTYTDGYAVIVKTPWVNEQLGIEKRGILDGDEWIEVKLESEIDVVEMNYNH
ncbi:hypothetical protein [Clostridium aciditolerans]|uniref:Uncharacterized protein n=1 Tax=Clostridium aciditolerans TaxID=339861 RepID=A0A934HN69_9CLOT|nr:hypothetical protein [Clostridium aciditolerans]MBI6871341.1 hypothetical protein [Clostridium aciditolerans]